MAYAVQATFAGISIAKHPKTYLGLRKSDEMGSRLGQQCSVGLFSPQWLMRYLKSWCPCNICPIWTYTSQINNIQRRHRRTTVLDVALMPWDRGALVPAFHQADVSKFHRIFHCLLYLVMSQCSHCHIELQQVKTLFMTGLGMR